MKRGKKWFGVAVLVILVAVVGTVVWQREWINDFYRGLAYQPSGEMVRIRDALKLTEKGEFWFNATQPEALGAEEFNVRCLKEVSETAVLGCYVEQNIYVYNITDESLAGIRELTTAHELLHASWARMSEEEKASLTKSLAQTLEENQDFLEEEIGLYGKSQRQEELYVRAGTEVADLPEVLEKHYGEIFSDQDLVVGFYESYIEVFRSLEAEMKELSSEIETLRSEVEARTYKYELGLERLEGEIASINSCAETVGCFQSINEFNVRRDELVAEQSALLEAYDEIGRLVDECNGLIEKYNSDVIYAQKLNNIVNSSSVPESL